MGEGPKETSVRVELRPRSGLAQQDVPERPVGIAQALFDDLAGKRRESRGGPRSRVVVQVADEHGILGAVLCRGRARSPAGGCDLGQHLAGRQQSHVAHHAGLPAVARPVDQPRMVQLAPQRSEHARPRRCRCRHLGRAGTRQIQKAGGEIQRRAVPDADRRDVEDIGEQVGRPAVTAGRQPAGHQPRPDGKRHRRLRPEGAEVRQQIGHAAGVVRHDRLQRHFDRRHAEVGQGLAIEVVISAQDAVQPLGRRNDDRDALQRRLRRRSSRRRPPAPRR